MHILLQATVVSVATISFAASADAQSSTAAGTPSSPNAIPIRKLGPTVAVAKDTLGPRIVARGLSDGSVLVGVFAYAGGNGKRRVKLFDSTLQQVTLVMDSTHMPQLIRYTGDSTVALDQPSTSLLVLDAKGNVARVMALPKPADFPNLVGFVRTPWFDPMGRLVYRATQPEPRFTPAPNATSPYPLVDSAPIVRGDFDTRRVDTIARLRIAQPLHTWATIDGGSISIRQTMNPVGADDEWTMLSDGTIAIVRAQDYHIDWIDPDGTHRSTPKMPYAWRRLTEAQKRAKVDSMKPTIDSINAANPPRTVQTPDGPKRWSGRVEAVSPDSIPDYEPAVGIGSVRADLDGRLWILPRSSVGAEDGLVYDVVNRKGEITERVQLPKGVVIAGFGPNGAVYLNRVVGSVGFLERARVR